MCVRNAIIAWGKYINGDNNNRILRFDMLFCHEKIAFSKFSIFLKYVTCVTWDPKLFGYIRFSNL